MAVFSKNIKKKKKQWEEEKLLVTSNFSFSYRVFIIHVLLTADK